MVLLWPFLATLTQLIISLTHVYPQPNSTPHSNRHLHRTLMQLGEGVSLTLVKLKLFTSWTKMNDDGLGLVAPGASVRDLDTGLAQMATWHQSRGTADVTHLVIGENLSGGTTGLAYTSQICDSTWSVGIIEDREAWQFTTETLTHELGHNLGSSHDKGRAGSLCDSSK